MLRATGLEISQEDRERCRETLVLSFGLGLNVSTVPLQPSFRGAFARKHRGDLSQSTLQDCRRIVTPVTFVHRLIDRITQVVDALGDEECLDWEVLKRLNTDDINAIPGLVAADQRQALVRAVNTMTMITTWSPAVHRYFPRDEREAIVATLLELKKAGLPNDVIVGHVLQSTFAPPWNDVFAENEEARQEARHAWDQMRFREERRRRLREAMGPGHPGMMNAAAVARAEGRALPYAD